MTACFLRRTFLLVAFAWLALAGCRELTVPAVEPEPAQTLRILGTDGQPLADVRVRLTDFMYPKGPELNTWEDYTDEDGIVHPELPPGSYWLHVYPSRGTGQPDWVDSHVVLDGETRTVDPRLRLRHGLLTVPDEFEDRVREIRFNGDVEINGRPIQFVTTAPVRDDLSFDIVWEPGTEYVATLDGSWLTVLLAADMLGDHPDSMLVDWNPDYFQAEFTLGGAPLPAMELDLRASGDGYQIEVTRIVEGGPASFAAQSGPGALEIEPRSGIPVFDREVNVDFQPGGIPVFELGEYRVEFRMTVPGGGEAYGAGLQLQRVRDRRSLTLARVPQLWAWLRPGAYEIYADCPGFEDILTVATITADTTITLEFTPESTSNP